MLVPPAMAEWASMALVLGGTLSAVAAVAHLACIAIGAPAYRLMGAGERMARAAELRRVGPTLITLGIAATLSLWAAYAFAGAGIAPRLPFMKAMLLLIGGAYLLRALGFPLLRLFFPEDSERFWRVSSGLCAAIGLLHVSGTTGVWAAL